ncbi:restriction endonuclease subunit S [Acinetobacter sp. YH12103]|uniref:restriction endonuclease subunit S n=1 Tax=Acinetobacter sp. YH12103 TaxID=2601092 RepID=UPI0015D24D71|nr:restriction endonuclease subunit S [Acinetobacter sp. YH12103]
MVPNGWKRVPIKEVCHSIIDCVNKTAPVVDYETPYKMIRTSNVRNGRVNTFDVRYVTKETYEQWTRRGAPLKGDVILTREAPVGEVGILENAEGIFLGQRLMMYRANKKIADNYYLFYSLSSAFCQKQIEDYSNGGTVAHMRVPDCGEILVNLPPLLEQQKIAQILLTWDQAISATEKLLENSQQQKKALMQQLLTGKKRLLDENGVMFSSKWLSEKLEKICAISTGKKDVNEGNPEGIYPFFTCASEPTASDSYSYDCEALLIAGNGNLGKTHYFNGKFEAYQRTYILSKFNEKIQPLYLYQYILYWLMRDIEREKQHGAMPYIKLGLLQNFNIFIPSITEQLKIIEVLSLADQEIETLQKKLDCLKQEKKALMQQLLTGKKRVKVAA